jgi:ParB/RepB/Spo0J family partition protein
VDLKEEIARKRAEANRTDTDERNSSPDQTIDLTVQDQLDPDAVLLMVNQIEVKAQGRTTFKELEALASDIKAVGQLQPIVVKQIDANRYRLVAGERRYRAISQILKQDTIRATIRRVEESETDTRFVQISENTQRDDYLPLELAAELADLKAETGFTIEQIASRIGKSKGFVSKYISLLNAPDDIKQAIEGGAVSATAWFNNKAMVTQQIKDEQTGSIPPKVIKRKATLPVSIDIALDFARILQTLSKQKGLADIDVDLSGSVTKKQLQAILTSRTNEILESL